MAGGKQTGSSVIKHTTPAFQIQHFLDLIFVHIAALFDTRYTIASGPGSIHAFGWLTSKLVTKNRCPSRMSPGDPPSLNTMRIGSHSVIWADRIGSLLRHRASFATTTRKSRTLRGGQMCYQRPCQHHHEWGHRVERTWSSRSISSLRRSLADAI